MNGLLSIAMLNDRRVPKISAVTTGSSFFLSVEHRTLPE